MCVCVCASARPYQSIVWSSRVGMSRLVTKNRRMPQAEMTVGNRERKDHSQYSEKTQKYARITAWTGLGDDNTELKLKYSSRGCLDTKQHEAMKSHKKGMILIQLKRRKMQGMV